MVPLPANLTPTRGSLKAYHFTLTKRTRPREYQIYFTNLLGHITVIAGSITHKPAAQFLIDCLNDAHFRGWQEGQYMEWVASYQKTLEKGDKNPRKEE